MGALRRERTGVWAPLHGCTRIGRHPDSDVLLAAPRASSTHAELRWREAAWWVRDLGSTNGTRVGEVPVSAASPRALAAGDELTFGDGDERWTLVDAGPPRACVWARERGVLATEEAGQLLVPGRRIELVRSLEGEGWVAWDVDREETVPIEAIAAGHGLFVPRVEAVATTARPPVELAVARLRVEVPADLARVDLVLEGGGRTLRFPERSWALPLYVLAVARQQDVEGGGWMPVERLARRSGLDRKVLDVYLGRAREAFVRAEVGGGAGIVEVRSGARRLGLGPDRVEVATVP